MKDGANSSKGSQGDSGLVRISEEVVVRLFRECEFVSACECEFLGECEFQVGVECELFSSANFRVRIAADHGCGFVTLQS